SRPRAPVPAPGAGARVSSGGARRDVRAGRSPSAGPEQGLAPSVGRGPGSGPQACRQPVELAALLRGPAALVVVVGVDLDLALGIGAGRGAVEVVRREH